MQGKSKEGKVKEGEWEKPPSSYFPVVFSLAASCFIRGDPCTTMDFSAWISFWLQSQTHHSMLWTWFAFLDSMCVLPLLALNYACSTVSLASTDPPTHPPLGEVSGLTLSSPCHCFYLKVTILGPFNSDFPSCCKRKMGWPLCRVQGGAGYRLKGRNTFCPFGFGP